MLHTDLHYYCYCRIIADTYIIMHVILYYIRVPIYYEHVFDFCILLGRIIVAASHRILLDI